MQKYFLTLIHVDNFFKCHENILFKKTSARLSLKPTLQEKCPNTIFFWSVFSCVRSEYRKIWTKKYSVFVHFLSSGIDKEYLIRHFFFAKCSSGLFLPDLRALASKINYVARKLFAVHIPKTFYVYHTSNENFFNHRQMCNMLQWKRYLHWYL